ncbi:MAG: hypothetical protein QW228_06300 [Candidatus Aenigmatarchaeota archaeon]
MWYAIIYNGEPKEIDMPDGIFILQPGMLLGYTEYPDDETWQDYPEFQFVKTENIEKEPLKWEYKNGQWLEIDKIS